MFDLADELTGLLKVIPESRQWTGQLVLLFILKLCFKCDFFLFVFCFAKKKNHSVFYLHQEAGKPNQSKASHGY